MADEHVESLGTAGDVVWPLTDNLGTVRDLATYDSNTDVTTIANHRVYDAYGNRTSQTNSAVDCLFGYTARQYDEVSNLQNNLNRWYDAKVGRWVSEDPIGFWGGDTNTSRYVGNSPLNLIDPSGLCRDGEEKEPALGVEWVNGETRTPDQQRRDKQRRRDYNREQKHTEDTTDTQNRKDGIKDKYKDQDCGKATQKDKEAIERELEKTKRNLDNGAARVGVGYGIWAGTKAVFEWVGSGLVRVGGVLFIIVQPFDGDRA